MGSLTPGATYIYESPDGGKTVYAREFGKNERQLVGKNYTPKELSDQMKDFRVWSEICELSKTNPSLQRAIENVILIYQLSRDYE